MAKDWPRSSHDGAGVGETHRPSATGSGWDCAPRRREHRACEFGRDAVRLRLPKVVVTDHLMSVMPRTDLARLLMERQLGPPVLIISGYAEDEGVASDLPRLTALRAEGAGHQPDEPSKRVQGGEGVE